MGKYLDRMKALDSGNMPTQAPAKTALRAFDSKDSALGRRFSENDDPLDSKDSSLTGRFSESEEATPHRAWRIGHEAVDAKGNPAVVVEPVPDDERTPPPDATGDDAADWTTMVDGVRDCLRGHGVEIGPVIDRLTSDELTDWRSGWFGPAEVRAFAGVAVANRLAGACRLLVRCTDCRHFERHEWHPHLGACAMHERPPGAAGWWDDDLHACERFNPCQAKGSREIVTPGPCPAVTTRNEGTK